MSFPVYSGMKAKIDRESVFNKYGGRCAYCGCELKGRWQVDHIHPQFLQHLEPDLDPNRFENLNPSCIKCNRFKSSFQIEDFRRELQLQVDRLLKNAQFVRALDYGLVELTGKKVQFYFEKDSTHDQRRGE